MIRELQPNIVIWNDGGDRADLRWVGTEEGSVGETNWSLLNGTGEVEWNMLHFGLETGDSWVPGEVNTSIRPEWFYHPSEDSKVKTVPKLVETYYNSIGRNGTLLLNFPIMPNGLIHEKDEKAALEFAEVIKASFDENLAENMKASATNVRGDAKTYGATKVVDNDKNSYWATDDSVTTASLTIEFDKPTLFNRFMVQEYIQLGQRVKSFSVEAFVDGNWKQLANATTIGYKRILRFPAVEATQVRLNITDSKSCPVISNIGIYSAPVSLDAPVIYRNQTGEVTIKTNDVGPFFYYTLDGTEPTTESEKYTEPFQTEGKVQVKAIAYDPASAKSSPVCTENFDVCRKNWKILGTDDEKVKVIFDGNPLTAWHQSNGVKMPADLIIDLDSELTLTGFKYYPDQGRWGPGIITNYKLYVSTDNKNWKLVDEGEFSNIVNNPIQQVKTFAPAKARYIKFQAVKNAENNNNIGYSEVDIITN